MESKHLVLGHETGFIILFGMLISWVVYQFDSHDEADKLVFQFNTQIFFDLALPAILFSAGFNMRRKEFFKNFPNIVKFGIFGSLFTFVFFVFFTWILFQYGNITIWNPDANEGLGATEDFNLTMIEIMLVCSILVSSDIIAAMSILNVDE